jgi:hypothetical protein
MEVFYMAMKGKKIKKLDLNSKLKADKESIEEVMKMNDI